MYSNIYISIQIFKYVFKYLYMYSNIYICIQIFTYCNYIYSLNATTYVPQYYIIIYAIKLITCTHALLPILLIIPYLLDNSYHYKILLFPYTFVCMHAYIYSLLSNSLFILTRNI